MLIALLLAASLPAFAGKGAPSCRPLIEKGWVRMAPGMPMGAAFGVVRNPCDVPVEIVGASSPAFDDVSLHETRLEGGVSRMRAVPRIVMRAGGAAELKPGGLHAMLMKPVADVKPGSRVRVEFELADGRRLPADLPVRASAP